MILFTVFLLIHFFFYVILSSGTDDTHPLFRNELLGRDFLEFFLGVSERL